MKNPNRPILGQTDALVAFRAMKRYSILFALTVWCLVTFDGNAQGTAFTYQGRLNQGANPASGLYDFQFTIHDSANNPGGIVAGPVTHSATAVNNGLFTVTLDFGANVFNGANRWMEIGVRAPGGTFATLSPRQAITPVPYAVYAMTPAGPQGPQGLQGATGPAGAMGLQGPIGLTGITGAKGDKGDKGDIGLTGPAGPLSPNVALRAGGNTFSDIQTFNGQMRLDSPAGFSQSSIGAFSIDAPFLPGGRLVVLEDGKVGIGTFAPESLLSVGGDVAISTQGSLNFGAQTRQMLNLYNGDYGIGVQDNTEYFRSANSFRWLKGGVHKEYCNTCSWHQWRWWSHGNLWCS